MAQVVHSIPSAVEKIFNQVGENIRLATPLGLGKPNILLNALYQRVKADARFNLSIYTALSLNPPHPTADLAKRFFGPFAKRHWGENYPELLYAQDGERDQLPKNVRVHEFYFRAGSALGSRSLQKDYQSINYTHVAEGVHQTEINLVVQMIAKDTKSGEARYSLSCNPDVTLDLADLYKESGKPLFIVGVIHPDLPFLGGDAEVKADFFNLIVDEQKPQHELFALPRLPISEADHAIGFYASQLVADDGTLQVGIGSLSDAVVSAMILRHKNNDFYNDLVKQCWKNRKISPTLPIENKPFEKGIYGLSEMVTDGYMHLRRAGILKREVIDEKSGMKTYLHGAFYLGSKDFYSWLRELKGEEFSGLRMTRVSKVNDLYDPNEILLRRQRKNPRFLNTCMQVSILGGAASETLADGRVVSGVGGQYNFVAMSQELKNSRSILMLRSVRDDKGKRQSNIVSSNKHITIPRHLRDIVITEYGIAELRYKTDEECIRALIEITDVEFQDDLVTEAKKSKKLPLDYEVPETARMNTAENVSKFIRYGQQKGTFGAFQLGSDFTEVEQKLALALEPIQNLAGNKNWFKKLGLIGWIVSGMSVDAKKFKPELERMNLAHPAGLMQKIYQLLLLKSLHKNSEI